jgi:Flp pilus assembly secretin CpaC
MFRFTIRDILWLTLVVASFLGGRYWNQMALPKRPTIVPAGVVTIKLAAGGKAVVKATVPVKRMLVADQTMLTIVPVSHNSFELTATKPGKTKVEICGDSENPTVTYDVTVQ